MHSDLGVVAAVVCLQTRNRFWPTYHLNSCMCHGAPERTDKQRIKHELHHLLASPNGKQYQNAQQDFRDRRTNSVHGISKQERSMQDHTNTSMAAQNHFPLVLSVVNFRYLERNHKPKASAVYASILLKPRATAPQAVFT